MQVNMAQRKAFESSGQSDSKVPKVVYTYLCSLLSLPVTMYLRYLMYIPDSQTHVKDLPGTKTQLLMLG